MIKEINEASLDNLHSWWKSPPKELMGIYGKGTFLEEIAFAITEKDPQWINFLNDYAYSEDIKYRHAAIFFLASKKNDSSEIEKILKDAFYSENIKLQISSLQGMINIGLYPIEKNDSILLKVTNNTVAAWGMTYLCYAYPEERIKILKQALKSNDSRMREFASDVIGDEFIQELKPDLEKLLTDENSIVADAAKYNFYEMLD